MTIQGGRLPRRRLARSGIRAADFPPDQSVGYLVRETHRAFLRALGARVSRHGVSIGMWYFLRALWEEDGLTQRELSRRVRMMEPTTATALESMERRGLISRTRNSQDRRKVNIRLTDRRPALAGSAAALCDGSEPGRAGRNIPEENTAAARATRSHQAQSRRRRDPGRRGPSVGTWRRRGRQAPLREARYKD